MSRSVTVHSLGRTLLHCGMLTSLLLASMVLVFDRSSSAIAQSATPVATNTAVCAPPAAANAPDVPASVANPGNGTPAAVLEVDSETGANIHALIDSLAACLATGNAEGVAQLVTDRYLGDAYGAGERMTKADYLALAPSAPVVPVAIRSVGPIDFASADTATAQVILLQGNQLRTEEWTFLFRRDRGTLGTPTAITGNGHWLVHQIAVLQSAIPTGATEVKTVQSDYAVKMTPDKVTSDTLAIAVQNTGKETHEFLVLKLESGASVDQLIRPTSDTFPADIEVIGQETILAGETRTMVLMDLAPGTYTVVCLLPDADGVPHLALGETTTFTVS